MWRHFQHGAYLLATLQSLHGANAVGARASIRTTAARRGIYTSGLPRTHAVYGYGTLDDGNSDMFACHGTFSVLALGMTPLRIGRRCACKNSDMAHIRGCEIRAHVS
ncbi:hypothetical protein B0H12DRAFT_1229051 [Mycena haematopus]|nr:hypothetical protein B0H12DRAFT_1229051 [Mycena haematopus]